MNNKYIEINGCIYDMCLFGNFLKVKMLEKNISKVKLGKLLGVSRQAVYCWEIGTDVPCKNNLIKLSKILDFKLDELLNFVNDYIIDEKNKLKNLYNFKKILE